MPRFQQEAVLGTLPPTNMEVHRPLCKDNFPLEKGLGASMLVGGRVPFGAAQKLFDLCFCSVHRGGAFAEAAVNLASPDAEVCLVTFACLPARPRFGDKGLPLSSLRKKYAQAGQDELVKTRPSKCQSGVRYSLSQRLQSPVEQVSRGSN